MQIKKKNKSVLDRSADTLEGDQVQDINEQPIISCVASMVRYMYVYKWHLERKSTRAVYTMKTNYMRKGVEVVVVYTALIFHTFTDVNYHVCKEPQIPKEL